MNIRLLALFFGILISGPLAALQDAIAPAADGALLERREVVLDEAQLPELTDETRAIMEGVVAEAIVYASDGLQVEGYLVRPKSVLTRAKPLPCVIYNRGGNRGFGALDDPRAVFFLGKLALRGYIVVASQYRGNGPGGLERYPGRRICEDCENPIGGHGREEFGGEEVNDILSLIPLLESLPEADASRIGMFGWSRGGMMTYLALAKTDRIEAAVIGAGVADAYASIEERPDLVQHVYAELIPGWEDEAIRELSLENRSALRWVNLLPKETPLLLLHGGADWRVSPNQSFDMARALFEVQHPFRFVFFEGGDHGLTEHRAEVDRVVGEWLDRYVRDGQQWPSLEPHGR